MKILIVDDSAMSRKLVMKALPAGLDVVVTQAEPAPFEQDDVAALRRAGVQVLTVAPTSLFDLADLPFKPAAVPTVFTPFRHAVEGERTPVHPPMAVPRSLPPLPDTTGLPVPVLPTAVDSGGDDPRSSFPYARPGWTGSARDALAHVQRYFAGPLPRQYKATRNGLSGTDFSTKFSPWLATGALSPRQIHAELLAHEAREGASDGKLRASMNGRVVAVHRSAPLRDLLVPIHHRSLNLDCECLLRTLGGGRAAAGLAAIRDHLAQRALPLAGYEQTDGSGLSRTNMITPELLTRANAAVLNGAQGREFLDSWPVLRAPRRPGGALIQAKNGSIERVRAWTGHIECGDGRRYIFSLLVNNYDGDYERDVAPAVAAVIEAMSDW